MDNQNNFYQVDETVESPTRLRDLLDKYLAYWKWFVVGSVVALVASYMYIRYSLPNYEVKASVLIKNDEKGNALSELTSFGNFDLLEGQSNIDDEIEILKSRKLMGLVSADLGLNIQYSMEEGPLMKEQYVKKPLKIHFIAGDSSIYGVKADFSVSVLSASTIELTNNSGKSLGRKKFGEKIHMTFGDFIVTPNRIHSNAFIGKTINVSIVPLRQVVDYYANHLHINPIKQQANVIEILLTDPSKEKAADIVNMLIDKYNSDVVQDKNQVALNTADFINERIAYITRELSEVEIDVEQFKTKNQLVDVVSEAGLFLTGGAENNKEILTANTQLRLVEYMNDYIRNQKTTTDLVPANLGIEDASIVGLTNTYNNLVLERSRLLKSSSDKNPVIVSLDEQLYSLHRNLKESLNNLKVSMAMKLRALENEERVINSKIASVPKYEREFREIQRQQQIKESLYLYLLQKREETTISMAVAVANAKIIDRAYSNGLVVSPKKRVVYGVGLLTGLLLVFLVIYVIDLADTKVKGKKELDNFNIPYVGDIPKVDLKERLVVRPNDNSPISEAFRLVRTNLSFMVRSEANMAKMIFLSSTISKEGKSFVALNLAATYALSDKKVVLVGFDLRAPKIQEYLSVQPTYGVTNYITDPELKVNDLLMKMPGYKDFSIIASGPIPPNPAELIASDRVKELFERLKEQFDIVIVDTAPVGLVADTLLVTQFADLLIYVVRSRYLDKRMLSIPEQLYKQKRIPKMAFLLNSIDQKRDLGYGYGYGYGYGVEVQRPWWKRVFGIGKNR